MDFGFSIFHSYIAGDGFQGSSGEAYVSAIILIFAKIYDLQPIDFILQFFDACHYLLERWNRAINHILHLAIVIS